MKYRVFLFLFLQIVIFYGYGFADDSWNTELIVSKSPDCSEIEDWPEEVIEVRRIPGTNVFRLKVIPGQLKSVFSRLSVNPGILYAKIPIVYSFPRMEVQEYFTESIEWQEMIHLGEIQKISNGSGPVIALLDTGIDLWNPDLFSMIWYNSDEIPDDGIDNDSNGYVDDHTGFDFGDQDPDVQDYYGHGTHMSSVMRDIAPGARIMVLKINPGGTGSFSESALLEAIYYAKNNGADVISMSLSISSSDFLEAAVQSAFQSGCVLSAAAGNNGKNSDVAFPASMIETIAVGAMSTENQVASWISPTGSELDIMAPGVSIPVTGLGGTQEYTTGTSVSTAMISAVCAIIRSMNSGLSPLETRDVLIHGVNDLGTPGKDEIYGYGAFDGAALYNHVRVDVGQQSGSWTYTVTSQTPVGIYVNTANPWPDLPIQEWFVLSAVIQGQAMPVYLFTGADLIMPTESTDIDQYVYPYGYDDITLVGEFSMSDLGLTDGDVFLYAYACSTATEDIQFPEIVSIQVIQ